VRSREFGDPCRQGGGDLCFGHRRPGLDADVVGADAGAVAATSSARTTGAITICAMRSPRRIVNGV